MKKYPIYCNRLNFIKVITDTLFIFNSYKYKVKIDKVLVDGYKNNM